MVMSFQELHGIPMLKIMRAILELERNDFFCTASAIAKKTEKNINDVNILLNYYWKWGYTVREDIKKDDIRAKSGRSSFYWILTKNGMRKYHKLKREFGHLL